MQELIISYPLQREFQGQFRIRTNPDDPGVLVSAIAGMARVVRTDNEVGRLHIVASLLLDTYLGKPRALLGAPDTFLDQAPSNAVEIKGSGYWRLCYRRSNHDWRVRDEDHWDTLHFVSTYRGILNIDWYDHTAHLYHVGPVYLHEGSLILLPGDGRRPDYVQERIDGIANPKETVVITR
jgi:hypothetical protein